MHYPPSPPAPAPGLTPRDLARAALRGLVVALALGALWLYAARYVLEVQHGQYHVFVYGALLGAVAGPLAVGEVWARSRTGSRLVAIPALGLLALLWFWLAGGPWSYMDEMASSGDPAKALEAMRSSLVRAFSPPLRYVVRGLLEAFAFAVPFALSAWGRLRGEPLGWRFTRTAVGSMGLCGAALYLHLVVSPFSVPAYLRLPLYLTVALAALGLPLVDAGLDRLCSAPASGARPLGDRPRSPLVQVALLVAVLPLAFGAVQVQRWFAERAAAAERAAEEAAVAAAAERLSELQDANELPAWRLGLAAYLGDPAAARVLGDDAPSAPKRWYAWRKGIEEHGGPSACRRVAIAFARSTLRSYAKTKPGDPSLEEALAAAAGQVACPCPEHRLAAEGALKHLMVPKITEAKGALYHGPQAVEAALKAATSDHPAFYLISAGHSAESLTRSDRRLRAAVRDEVVPWALGRDDPLALGATD